MSEVPIVSYHAACLWEADAETLRPRCWLNDNILCFWAEWLTHEVFAGRADIAFIHPAAAFMAMFEGACAPSRAADVNGGAR